MINLFSRFRRKAGVIANTAGSDVALAGAAVPITATDETAHVLDRVTWVCREVAKGKDESGATAIEYGLIVAGIAVAIIAAINGVGSQLNATLSGISTRMN